MLEFSKTSLRDRGKKYPKRDLFARKFKDVGKQIKRNAFVFFFDKHSWAPKINPIGKYVLIKKEI